MSMPGWYPDPAGGQGRFRFWDGEAWSSQTTTNPADPAPGAPQQRPGGRDRPGRLGIVLAAVAVVVLAIVLWFTLGEQLTGGFTPVPADTNSAEPTVSGWDETSRPTPPPTQASLTDCPITSVEDETPQRNDNHLHGGGLSVAKISGWRDSSMHLQWVSDMHVQIDEVRPGWISNIGVGQLNAVDGFDNAQVAARQTMECFASSGYYLNFTHRIDLVNEETTVDGHPAWRLRSEVHISTTTMPEIDGDVVDVIVVDLGDPDRMGLFVSSVTIGDSARQQLVDAAITSLRVE